MHRCLVPSLAWHGARVDLPSEARHYLLDVLRLACGDELKLFDGVGREVVARLVSDSAHVGDGAAYCDILREVDTVRSAVSVTLYQAIPKQRRMELIIEKGTELGVTRVVPMVTERTIVRLDPKQAGNRLSRWQRIAEAASRQCGRASVPEITSVAMSVEAALQSGPIPDLLLVGVIRPDTEPLRGVLDEAEAAGVTSVGMIIGPEGDLTPNEVDAALAVGGRPVTFGPQVLRVETASLFALSVLSHRLAW
jgi:16S rRNA (uracil1498-N3)-methyltransferase